ncbi:MAG: hypothetical protein CFE44_01400 [Burkholderiales bacterium PBB4]|nr:MAG: hypothetical protein CFE44_01400 [Burkholderiales bacterium PBB4]
MLQALAPNLWHTTHHFKANGLAISSRMTVVRLANGTLWLHSPVPIDAALQTELKSLGEVSAIVAPNKMHHLFAGDCAALYPRAQLFGAPGLRRKRPDLTQMQDLPAPGTGPWCPELDHLVFGGIPLANETDWFHAPSGTLILTDLCQWMDGDLSWATVLFAKATGARDRLDVPRTVRLLVRDPAAAHASAVQLLRWPTQRLVVAHNVVIENRAHAQLAQALKRFG